MVRMLGGRGCLTCFAALDVHYPNISPYQSCFFICMCQNHLASCHKLDAMKAPIGTSALPIDHLDFTFFCANQPRGWTIDKSRWCPGTRDGAPVPSMEGWFHQGTQGNLKQRGANIKCWDAETAFLVGVSRFFKETQFTVRWSQATTTFNRIETTSLFLKHCKVFLQSKATFSVFATFSLTCLKLRHDALTA